MNRSKRASPVGRPFKKGKDDRRNSNGSVCLERAQWAAKFHNALSKKITPDAVADILVDAVRKGRPWAIELYLDRLIGKEVQPISGQVDSHLTIEVVKVDRPT